MTQKKSYSRYFIILQEDEKGYALATDKLPSGYAKLEIKNDKCKVSYYVQNLKKESAPYYMVLICNKKDAKKLLKLGELNIDEHGRAEVYHEYPMEDIANCGVNVDKVAGASIVRMMNSNIISVMSGFASTDIPDWKGFPMIEDNQNRQEEVVEDRLDKKVPPVKIEPVQVEPEVIEQPMEEIKEEPVQEPANIFDEYEMQIEAEKEQMPVEQVESIEETEEEQPNNNSPMYMMDYEDERHKKKCKKESNESKHENECHDNKKHEYEENKKESNESKHENECHDNKKHEHEENKKASNECKHENECHDKKDHYDYHKKCKENYPKGSVGSFFMDVANGFEELQDMCSEIKRCKWYKVPVHSEKHMSNCLDYNKYTVAYYPMINYYQYIRKFGHFILGYKLDQESKMKYLVYGIPGTKSRQDQPFGGKSGFVTWIPLKEGDEDEDSYGYWLMFYDFRNSTIIIPIK